MGFLLVISFSTRFNHVSKFERAVYYLTLLTAGLAAFVIIAPVAHPRIVFRKHEKAALIRRGHQMASAGLARLSIALLGVLMLVTNFLFDTTLTICTSVVCLLAVSALWLALPVHSRRHPRRSPSPVQNRRRIGPRWVPK